MLLDRSAGAGDCARADEAARHACAELGWFGSVRMMDTFWKRLTGFLVMPPADEVGSAHVLVFPLCCSVHTFGMSYPLDIAFADRAGRVITLHEAVVPHRVVACREAFMALERPALDVRCGHTREVGLGSRVASPSIRSVVPPVIRAGATCANALISPGSAVRVSPS